MVLEAKVKLVLSCRLDRQMNAELDLNLNWNRTVYDACPLESECRKVLIRSSIASKVRFCQ